MDSFAFSELRVSTRGLRLRLCWMRERWIPALCDPERKKIEFARSRKPCAPATKQVDVPGPGVSQ